MPRKRKPSRPETVATRWLREMVLSQQSAAIRARAVPDGDTIRRAVVADIRAAVAGSNQSAREKAEFIMAIGLDRYVCDAAGDIIRSPRVLGAVTYQGQVATGDVPERVSIPPRDQNGARIKKPGTYPMWLSIPTAEFFAKLADIDLAYDMDGLRRALWHKAAMILRQHPTAANPLEAIGMAGMTVDQFLATP